MLSRVQSSFKAVQLPSSQFNKNIIRLFSAVVKKEKTPSSVFNPQKSAVLTTSMRKKMLNHANGPYLSGPGGRYLDGATGIGVNAFGNLPPDIVAAVTTSMMGPALAKLAL